MNCSIKNILDYIPVVLTLGILAGFGSYTALLGALIISVVFCLFKRDCSFILGAGAVFVLVSSSFNAFLGGTGGSFFALLFISSLFIILFSFFGQKMFENIPRPVSSGFTAGVYLGGLILCIPLIFGQKTFSALFLMFGSKYGVFAHVDEFAVVCAVAVLAVYYYLCKYKIKFLPPAFCAVFAGALINFIYGFNLQCADAGFKGFIPVIEADFGHFGQLLVFGFLIALVLTAEIFELIKTAKNKNFKQTTLLIGISNLIGAITGSIAGGINKGREKCKIPVIEALILFIFTAIFGKIAAFIPIAAIAAILAIKIYEKLKLLILAQKAKMPLLKTVFWVCALIAAYSVTAGLIFAVISVLISKKPVKKLILDFLRR